MTAKIEWKKLRRNLILQKEGFFLSYNPRPEIGNEGAETAIVSPIRGGFTDTRYLILLGDFRKQLQNCNTLKEAEDFFLKNIDKKGSWSNDLND